MHLSALRLHSRWFANASHHSSLTIRPNLSFFGRRMASTLPNSAIFKTLASHKSDDLAIVHSQSGRTFTYGSLIHDVAAAKDVLWERGGRKSLKGERIAFLAENGYDYVGKGVSSF